LDLEATKKLLLTLPQVDDLLRLGLERVTASMKVVA
jgi:hypothetical protein